MPNPIDEVWDEYPPDPNDDPEPVIDPVCRDGKCSSCVGGPCEHECHQPAGEAPAAETVTLPPGIDATRGRWCRNRAPHDPHGWPPDVDGDWCSGVDERGLRRYIALPEAANQEASCRPVELDDGSVIRVMGTPDGEVPPGLTAALTDLRQAVQRRHAAEHPPAVRPVDAGPDQCPRSDVHGPHRWRHKRVGRKCPGLLVTQCRAEYPGSGQRGARVVACDRPRGHEGDHVEYIGDDAGLSWPVADAEAHVDVDAVAAHAMDVYARQHGTTVSELVAAADPEAPRRFVRCERTDMHGPHPIALTCPGIHPADVGTRAAAAAGRSADEIRSALREALCSTLMSGVSSSKPYPYSHHDEHDYHGICALCLGDADALADAVMDRVVRKLVTDRDREHEAYKRTKIALAEMWKKESEQRQRAEQRDAEWRADRDAHAEDARVQRGRAIRARERAEGAAAERDEQERIARCLGADLDEVTAERDRLRAETNEQAANYAKVVGERDRLREKLTDLEGQAARLSTAKDTFADELAQEASVADVEIIGRLREAVARVRERIEFWAARFDGGLMSDVIEEFRTALDGTEEPSREYVTVRRDDLRVRLDQRRGHSHTVPGIWDSDNGPDKAGKPCTECAADGRLRAALDSTGGEGR